MLSLNDLVVLPDTQVPPTAEGAEKLRLAFFFPGVNYRRDNAYVVSTEPLALELQRDFEVTLVFRTLIDRPAPGFRCRAILDHCDTESPYFLGRSPIDQLRYLREVRQFAARSAGDFDLVFEKAWPFMGAGCLAFEEAGVPSVPVLEGEFYLHEEIAPHRLLLRAQRAIKAQLMKSYLERAITASSGLVVETRQHGARLAEQVSGPLAARPVDIPIAVDSETYHPADRLEARRELGLDPTAPTLVYVGSLNGSIQHPDQVIEGMALAAGRGAPANLRLELLGQGCEQDSLTARVAELGLANRVSFRGFRPREEAARFIQAADLCLAPYRAELYRDGEFTSASCKVVEYLACARPVVTIPCGRMRDLTLDGELGFLVENDAEAYAAFFADFPSAERRHEMERALKAGLEDGSLAEQEIIISWPQAAERYAKVVAEVLARKAATARAPSGARPAPHGA